MGGKNWLNISGVSKIEGSKKMRDNIKVFDLSKSKGNMPWFEKSGGSKNRGLEKSEFHCKSEVTIDSTGSRKD